MGTAEAPTGPLLAARGLRVSFGGVQALSDVHVEVPPAAMVGLVGPNGAGKSTTFAVLSGLLRPDGGSVVLDGEDVTNLAPQHRARLGLARTFQQPELFTDLTVREHVVLADRMRHDRRRVWSDLFLAGALRAPGAGEAERVDSLIDRLGLGDLAHRSVGGLSLGSSRLVEVARALATRPRVLLLDEPLSGLSGAEVDALAAVLEAAIAEGLVSVLLVEHDIPMVLRLCSSIVVLDFGTVIASGTPDQIRNDPAVQAAYLGDSVGEVAT